MRTERFELRGTEITVYTAQNAEILFIQPADREDAEMLRREAEILEAAGVPYVLASFPVADWNGDLSPWAAPPVFGKTPFGGRAEQTLRFLAKTLLPALVRQYPNALPCLGGYSLAGLFALWAATQTDLFPGVAAASPSVWFPGWLDFEAKNPIRAKAVYLSLGDREERAKNPVMATVGDCIRTQYDRLRERSACTLQWNPGNHFRDAEQRTAAGFLWLWEHRNGEKAT